MLVKDRIHIMRRYRRHVKQGFSYHEDIDVNRTRLWRSEHLCVLDRSRRRNNLSSEHRRAFRKKW